MITFTDINGVFAPLCTSPEFQLKVSFTIEKKTKMQKLFKFQYYLYSKIFEVKYKFSSKDTFFYKLQKCPKKSIKVTIEKTLNYGMACLFTLLRITFWPEKLVIRAICSYSSLKVSIKHKK